jgi:hypothetical protein
MHSDAEGHETPRRGLAVTATGLLHVEPLFVELTAFPAKSTARQVADTHDTPNIVESSSAVADHFDAPPVGSVETTALPLLSTATQSGADVQETAVSRMPLSTSTGLLQLEPPSVEVTTRPPPSMATQSDVDGQDTPKKP